MTCSSKKTFYSLLLIWVILNTPCLSAQGIEPIDIQFDQCVEKSDGNTYALVYCADDYHKAWDSLLNKEYILLYKKLPKKQSEKLRISQREWLTLRQKDADFLTAYYKSKEGTMWGPVNIYNQAQSTKYRAMWLRKMRESLLD